MTIVNARSKKEETRERILRAAARAIRKHGYEGVGVADVMKEAGLTHGGFYAHFESRDALLAASADQAGAESIEVLTRAIAARGRSGAGLRHRRGRERSAAPARRSTPHRKSAHQGPHWAHRAPVPRMG